PGRQGLRSCLRSGADQCPDPLGASSGAAASRQAGGRATRLPADCRRRMAAPLPMVEKPSPLADGHPLKYNRKTKKPRTENEEWSFSVLGFSVTRFPHVARLVARRWGFTMTFRKEYSCCGLFVLGWLESWPLVHGVYRKGFRPTKRKW